MSEWRGDEEESRIHCDPTCDDECNLRVELLDLIKRAKAAALEEAIGKLTELRREAWVSEQPNAMPIAAGIRLSTDALYTLMRGEA